MHTRRSPISRSVRLAAIGLLAAVPGTEVAGSAPDPAPSTVEAAHVAQEQHRERRAEAGEGALRFFVTARSHRG